jgi:molybdopterin molybdotransferase
MLACEEAWGRIEPATAPRGRERLARAAALGRVLAGPLVATADLPAADVSALDGFALAGPVAPGTVLPVVATAAAGAPPAAPLAAGSVVEIWTGALLPPGADRVIGVEQTARTGDGRIRILEPPPAGHAVRLGGEVARAGAELAAAGTPLTPATLALAASQGCADLEVYRAPRVAFLVTGDEVLAPDSVPAPGQLRDSHTDFLLAAGRRLGLAFEALGRSPDDPARLGARLAGALDGADVLLTCGGVSMGGADHLRAVLEGLGCEIALHGVAMQPGKPLLVARRGETLVFGLPGNPASVMVAYRVFVRPALERMLGRAAAFWSDAVEVRLAGPLPAGRGRDRFLPARRAGPGAARPLEARGSHDLLAFGLADLLVRARPGDPERQAGAGAEAIDFS